MTQRVLSLIQPTSASFHIGNHLGALQNWVAMQDTYDCVYGIADLHAITVDQDPAQLRHQTLASFAQLVALGVDPQRSTLFVQSHVAEHTQLMWTLSCLTGLGEANRMTQFKDKAAKSGASSASVGLLTLCFPALLTTRSRSILITTGSRLKENLIRLTLMSSFVTCFSRGISGQSR